jgi:hypothetical protein
LHTYDRRRAGDEQKVASLKLAKAPKPGFDRPVGTGCFGGALRRYEVQLGRKMIKIVVKISHGEIIGSGWGKRKPDT